jgi:hypothetical protein
MRGGYYETVKRVFYGVIGRYFTVAGAQAADLPMNAQPVECVRGRALRKPR